MFSWFSCFFGFLCFSLLQEFRDGYFRWFFPQKKGAHLYDFAAVVCICFDVFGVDLWVQLLKFGEDFC